MSSRRWSASDPRAGLRSARLSARPRIAAFALAAAAPASPRFARPFARVRIAPLVLAAALAALGVPAPAAALEVPFLSGRVVDEAGILGPDAEQNLTRTLEELERATGAQVAVLTVPSLGGEALEDYSLRVAETWRLGSAERDDGVLLLIVRDDRKMRFEVGHGLEGAIPDVLAGRILDNLVRPRFRAGDFDGGVGAGVEAVAALVRGEAAEAVVPPPAAGFSRTLGCAPFFFWVLLFFVILPLLFGRKKRRFRVFGVPVVFGGYSGGSSRGGGGFSSGGFSGGGGSFGGGGASSSW